MTPELCSAVYQYLSVSPAKLVLVSLDDVIGTIDQQNLPAMDVNGRNKTKVNNSKIKKPTI